MRKCLADLKNSEIEDSNLKKMLEEKIKRLEDERLNLISTKNQEIQKLAEENKGHYESIKGK